MRATADGTEIIDMEEAMLAMAVQVAMPLDRTNTTISCIVTNARLTKAQATKIAQMAADAYAHTIRPTHTTNDGDTIYVLASGSLSEESRSTLPLDLIGLVATRTLEAAIVAGCTEATALHGLPAHRDLRVAAPGARALRPDATIHLRYAWGYKADTPDRVGPSCPHPHIK